MTVDVGVRQDLASRGYDVRRISTVSVEDYSLLVRLASVSDTTARDGGQRIIDLLGVLEAVDPR